MRQVQASEFRTTFGTYDEPIQVVKYKSVLGTWIPGTDSTFGTVQVEVGDTEPVKNKMAEAQKLIDSLEAEVKQLKRQLAAQAVPLSVGLSATIVDAVARPRQFHPVPKPGKK